MVDTERTLLSFTHSGQIMTLSLYNSDVEKINIHLPVFSKFYTFSQLWKFFCRTNEYNYGTLSVLSYLALFKISHYIFSLVEFTSTLLPCTILTACLHIKFISCFKTSSICTILHAIIALWQNVYHRVTDLSSTLLIKMFEWCMGDAKSTAKKLSQESHYRRIFS